MSYTLKTAATAAVIVGLFSGITPALADISPAIEKLLIVASKKDGGAMLDSVANLAIAADPEAKKDILEFIAKLKQNSPSPVKPSPEKIGGEKTIEATPAFFSFQGWDGELELNILTTSGNTSQQSFGLAGEIKQDSGQFHQTIRAFFDLNKNTGVKDKQQWGLSYKLDYDISNKLYITSFTGYENDQFGTFRERVTASLGLGYPVIDSESFSWKIEGGPGVLFTKALAGEQYMTSLNAFASSLFTWTINKRSDFSNQTNVYFGNRSVIESQTALKVRINGSLSSKFSYDIQHDRDAPLSRKKTDTVARAGLLYDF